MAILLLAILANLEAPDNDGFTKGITMKLRMLTEANLIAGKFKPSHLYMLHPSEETIDDCPSLGNYDKVPVSVTGAHPEGKIGVSTGSWEAFVSPDELGEDLGRHIVPTQRQATILRACLKGARWGDIKAAYAKAIGRKPDDNGLSTMVCRLLDKLERSYELDYTKCRLCKKQADSCMCLNGFTPSYKVGGRAKRFNNPTYFLGWLSRRKVGRFLYEITPLGRAALKDADISHDVLTYRGWSY